MYSKLEMKAILCALDFSATSHNVVRAALELADRKKERLVILYAYRLLQPAGADVASYRKSVEEQARTEFSELVAKLKMNGDVTYEFRAEIGFLSDRVEIFMRNNEVDLIVMGQHLVNTIHEHKGLSFEAFLNDSKVPVLVVPD